MTTRQAGRPTAYRRSRVQRRLMVVAWTMLLPFLLVFTLTVIAPLLYALTISVFQNRLIGGTVFVGLDNYARALTDPLLGEGVVRVLLFVAVQVPIMLFISLTAALALDSGRLAGSRIVRLGLFLPYAVPSVVAALMWGYIFGGQFGLVGQIWGFFGVDAPDLLGPGLMLPSIGNIVTWSMVGYNMLIFYAALRAVPTEIYEASAIDGAGEFRRAWSIKLPALRPAMLLALVFSIIGSLQLFNEPSILQALRPSVITTNYTPNLYAYSLSFLGGQINYAAAIAILMGLVTVIAAIFVQVVSSRARRGGRS
ncbi:sugar ABC transporter permease [Microbacterium awajiense]|uniref:Sugar ABC transporter permease n=2 Tax=Microbacterium awajiense TaxID=415214 RepID=A0ABP7AVR2_9MICO